MKPDFSNAPSTVDRLATADEIRAAVVPFSDPDEQRHEEIFHEIPKDTGGYVRITATELETALLVEAWTRDNYT